MRIRTSVVTAALLTIFAAGLAAQKKPETASAKVLALENKWTDAYKLKDVTSMNSLLNEDVIVTVEDGGIYSKTGYIAHVSDTNVHVDVAEIGDVKIRMHGNVAVVTGGYHEKGTSKGKPYEYRDRFTDVWMNVAGAWIAMKRSAFAPFSANLRSHQGYGRSCRLSDSKATRSLCIALHFLFFGIDMPP